MSSSASNDDVTFVASRLGNTTSTTTHHEVPSHEAPPPSGFQLDEIESLPLENTRVSSTEHDEWRVLCDKFATPEPGEQKNPLISDFYKKQKKLIKRFKTMDQYHSDNPPEGPEDESESHNCKTTVSFWMNMLLLCVKIAASILSQSLSVIASTLDSLLDVLSGLILYFTTRSVNRRNYFKYPTGKSRLNPLGTLIFACVMGTAMLQIVVVSIESIITPNKANLDIPTIAVLAFTIVTKLWLWWWCSGSSDSAVQAYEHDHRNDVWMNIAGTAGAALGVYVVVWADPLTAIVVSAYVIFNWASVVFEQLSLLVGRSASPAFLRQLTYLCLNHSREILQIDTVRAYRFGQNYFVEVDIVLPEDMTLRQTHDIGESLQIKLEQLPNIDRAFVHIDYEVGHKPEHKQL
eukprot:gnl/Spiro4/28760_TR14233_c0_g1_i1.p1 gnl/Spiro4/28760_TR14233_c0_g1~~gnl/Spiro4/28760_TR14233_c0_g1_i1.p1  ORF type:complete len:422 (+),score=88.44 gnl/Spiro4/28760_TR14233_c0_g1_i1:54-1268(+)